MIMPGQRKNSKPGSQKFCYNSIASPKGIDLLFVGIEPEMRRFAWSGAGLKTVSWLPAFL